MRKSKIGNEIVAFKYLKESEEEEKFDSCTYLMNVKVVGKAALLERRLHGCCDDFPGAVDLSVLAIEFGEEHGAVGAQRVEGDAASVPVLGLLEVEGEVLVAVREPSHSRPRLLLVDVGVGNMVRGEALLQILGAHVDPIGHFRCDGVVAAA
jgi:hypothetical protein